LLELSIVVVLAAHLMCVNVASAGPLVCIWLDWRGGRGDMLADRVGRFLCWKSLALLLVGGLLGLFLGYLHWDESYRHVLSRFPSKIFFGVWELIFSLVLITATGLLWRFAPHAKWARWGRAVMLILTGTNLLYHFPFLFAIISRVHAGAANPDGVVDAAVFRRLMMEDSVLPQAVHFVFASFAMVGMTLIGFAIWTNRSPSAVGVEAEANVQEPVAEEPADGAPADGPAAEESIEGEPAGGELSAQGQRIAAWGARLALVSTLCQIPIGLWLVVKLAPDAQQRVMGSDLIATGLFGLSILLSLSLLHHLAAMALGVPRKKSMVVSISMMVVLITSMTGVLQRI